MKIKTFFLLLVVFSFHEITTSQQQQRPPKQLKYALLLHDGSVTSKFTSINIPDTHLGNFLFDQLRKHGNKPLYVNDAPNSVIYSAASVKGMATKFAHGFLDLGVKEGDVVFNYTPSSFFMGVTLIAIALIGATISGAPTSHPKEELKRRVHELHAKVLICIQNNLETCIAVAKEEPSVKTIVIMEKQSAENEMASNTTTGIKVIGIEKLLQRKPRSTDPKIPLKLKTKPEKAIAYIYYTSGTTGLPKGVIRTHRNILATLLSAEPGHHYMGKIGGSMFCLQPMAMMSGVVNPLASVYLGNLCIFGSGFNLKTWLASVEKYRIERAFMAPINMLTMVKVNRTIFDNYNISSLKKWLRLLLLSHNQLFLTSSQSLESKE